MEITATLDHQNLNISFLNPSECAKFPLGTLTYHICKNEMDGEPCNIMPLALAALSIKVQKQTLNKTAQVQFIIYCSMTF